MKQRSPDRTASIVGSALLLSTVYTLHIFDWAFISGTGPYWEHLQLWDLDRAQALIGWRHFASDEWRFPLFWVASLSYPEGANIIFTDSIPLVAFVFKIVRELTGFEVNYLGLWMAFCYVMQGVAASLLMDALGVRHRLANLSGVLIALCAPILLGRFGHGALCAHFLILLALTSYFRLVENPHRTWLWLFLLAAPGATLLVTSYLGVMLAAIAVATALESWRRRIVSPAVAIGVPATLVAIATAVMGGSGMIGPYAPSPVGSGYGHFSMNLLAPFFGNPETYTQRLLGPVTVDATGGQYEGFNYLGFGVLVLSASWFASHPGQVWRSVRAHPALTTILVLLSIYAVSNDVFLGEMEVLRFALPAPATRIASAFRSSGRFFWPAYYVLTFGLLASVWHRFPGGAGLALLTVVACLQYVETQPMRASVAVSSSRVNSPHFVGAEVAALVNRAERLFVYPSYECTLNDPRWPEPNSWRAAIVELMLFTSHRALASNSAYVSRGRKDCDLERRSLPNGALDRGTLYVVRRTDAPAFTHDLGDTVSCLEKDSAFLCEAR